MKEFEIHAAVSYVSGGTRYHDCYIDYVNANTAAEAKKIYRAELKMNKKATPMKRPITLTYDFLVGKTWIRKVYTSTTYEDYHRVVRVLHDNPDHYKVVSVTRAEAKG